MDDTLITIIVPCHNAEDTVERCIDSICEQKYHNLQIVAVDDGSTDNTLSKLIELAKTDERITTIQQMNRGVSAARNRGIEEAQGEYIAFVDADDYVEKEYVKKLFLTMIDNEAELSICRYITPDSGVEAHTVASNQLDTNQKLLHEMMVPSLNIAAFVWNRLYRRSILINRGIRFNEDIFACEDTLFNYLYLQQIEKFAVCDEYLYHYVINPQSTMFGEGFNPKKISANKAFELMLTNCSDNSKEVIEVAAMWFNLIVKRQAYKNKAGLSKEEIASINKMLRLNPKAFMKSSVSIKYKIAYPFLRVR